jgi:perosamine synthetase
MEKIMSLANDFGLQVIEDSCETMFASQNEKRIGGFGDLACFSTYVAHLIVGGVGGLILTKNNKLAEICRSLMNHGRDSIYTNIDQDDASDDQLHRQIIERRYRYDRVGYSYRCTEFESAIALSELNCWQDNIIKRYTNAGVLSKLLTGVEELQLPYIPKDRTHAFMMYPMVLREGNRNDLLMYLEKHGIETRYLFPLLGQPIYKRLFPGEAEKYPVAQHLAKQGFFIGMHQGLTHEDIEYVSETIHNYFKEQKSIKLAFPEGAEL